MCCKCGPLVLMGRGKDLCLYKKIKGSASLRLPLFFKIKSLFNGFSTISIYHRPTWVLINNRSLQVFLVSGCLTEYRLRQRNKIVCRSEVQTIIEQVVSCRLNLVRTDVIAQCLSRHVALFTAQVNNSLVVSILVEECALINGTPIAETFHLIVLHLVAGAPALQIGPAETFTDKFIATFTANVVKSRADEMAVRISGKVALCFFRHELLSNSCRQLRQ